MKKIFVLFGFFILWQFLAMFINRLVFPTPVNIFLSFVSCYKKLFIHTGYSLFRISAGIVLSLAVGLPVGIFMGYNSAFDKVFSPFVYTFSPIPKIALLPVIMLFLGIGEFSKVFIIFIIMVFQIVVSVRDSIKNIPTDYFVPFYTVKAKGRWIVSQILIPASLPDTFTAIRVGLATSISVLFFTETFGTVYGIGFFIMDMWTRLDYKEMYLGIIWLGGIGFLLTLLVDKLEKWVCRWRYSDTK